jgi:pimeloyl-ACP methyl ester carboxylesterase
MPMKWKAVTLGLVAIALSVPTTRGVADNVRLQRVDGGQIAYETLGNSGPVVVFVSGQDEEMRGWDRVARPLAACTHVVLYDRPGTGRSSPRASTEPLLADTAAKELSDLLTSIKFAPPYILVGHSLGGLYVQAFARGRPDDVAAVVLVDAASQFEPPGVFVSKSAPAPGSTAAIESNGFAPSVKAMLGGPPFPPVPLIVLSATNHGDTADREALWRSVQARIANLSPRGHLEIVEGAGHFIQNDRPQAVIDAVLQAARETGADISACQARK